MAAAYTDAYRRYCWPVASVADLRLAPFHLPATEGAVHVDQPHAWHMETLARLVHAEEPVVIATPFTAIDLTDADEQQRGMAWWREMTERGGEGVVVKPYDFVARGRRGARGLSTKRSLALREFALGIEALERFARGEPLYRVHECVFGILALESEPVDPRL